MFQVNTSTSVNTEVSREHVKVALHTRSPSRRKKGARYTTPAKKGAGGIEGGRGGTERARVCGPLNVGLGHAKWCSLCACAYHIQWAGCLGRK